MPLVSDSFSLFLFLLSETPDETTNETINETIVTEIFVPLGILHCTRLEGVVHAEA